MTRFRVTSISAFLTIAVLALGACGGDDEGSQDSANTGTDTAATTGTTETGTTTTGTNETGTTERERTERTETTKRKRKSSGSDDSSGGGNSGSGGGNSGSGGGGNSGADAEKKLTGKTVFTTSKTVCSQFLPTALAKDLKDGDKSAEDIAKEYSSGYPAAERKRAYDGCLAGLKTRD